jgi:hypothetical protein
LSCTAATRIDWPVNIPVVLAPWRSDVDSGPPPAHLPIPPARLPLRHGGRALKRWRYVGAFTERVMVCVGLARVGGAPQAWWAVWDREQAWLRERTIFTRPARAVRLAAGRVCVRDGDCAIDLEVTEGPGVVTVCPHGEGHVWTRKQAAVPVRGSVHVAGHIIGVEGLGVVDDTAGYHERHTAWRWSAGVGRTPDGRDVGWNLVTGVNDPPERSERSVWVDGLAYEVGPVAFDDDLGRVRFAEGGALRFRREATRERHDELVVARSDYVQPFGTFAGVLPGGHELAAGFGVMEDHRARW